MNNRKFVKRDYWNREETHRPYQNIVHTEEDEREVGYVLEALINYLEDGAEFTISIMATGKRHPGKWKLTAPHTYSRVDDEGLA